MAVETKILPKRAQNYWVVITLSADVNGNLNFMTLVDDSGQTVYHSEEIAEQSATVHRLRQPNININVLHIEWPEY